MSTEPSAFFCSPGVFDDRLDHFMSRISPCVARSYTVADQYSLTGAFAGTFRRYVLPPSKGRASLIHDGHQIVLSRPEMLGAEVRHRIGDAAAVHRVGIGVGEVRHHPFRHTRHGGQCPVGAFIERRCENSLILEIEPGVRFASCIVENLLCCRVRIEWFALFDADAS